MEIQTQDAATKAAEEIDKPIENADITAQTVETTNIHGQKMLTVVTTPYEQQKFQSSTDWRARAIEASKLSS